MPNKLVLIVDDEDSIQKLVTIALESAGYDTVACSNGQTALKLFAKASANFSLVLMDITMPGANGDEVARAMRAQNRRVPIILMSGYAREQIWDACDAFLQKPFRTSQLVDLVTDWTERPLQAATKGDLRQV